MLSLLLLNNIQQGSADALKSLKTLYEKAPFLVTVFWWQMKCICKNLHSINQESM